MALQAKMSEMFEQKAADKNLPMARLLAKRLGGIPEDQIEGVSQMLARNPQGMMTLIQELPMRETQEMLAGGEIPIGGGAASGASIEPQQPSQGYGQQVSGPPLQTPSSLTRARTPEPIPMKIARGTVGPQNITQETAAQAIIPSVQQSLASVQAPQQSATGQAQIQQQAVQNAPLSGQGPRGIPLAEATPKQLQEYVRTLPAKAVKPVVDAWKWAQKNRREEEELALRKREVSAKEAKVFKDTTQKGTADFIEKTRKEAEDIPEQQALLSRMKENIVRMNTGFFSLDNLADLTHVDAFRTARGAELFAAAKEYWLKDLKGTGGQKNMMLEKVLFSVLPNAGKRAEANLGFADLQQMKIDLSLGKWKIMQELRPQYTSKDGVVSDDLRDAVNKRFLEYADEVQNHTAYRIQRDSEFGKDDSDYRREMVTTTGDMKHVKDVYLTPGRAAYLKNVARGDSEKAARLAIKLGYKIPKSDWMKEQSGE
jgi:hypothetical protein